MKLLLSALCVASSILGMQSEPEIKNHFRDFLIASTSNKSFTLQNASAKTIENIVKWVESVRANEHTLKVVAREFNSIPEVIDIELRDFYIRAQMSKMQAEDNPQGFYPGSENHTRRVCILMLGI